MRYLFAALAGRQPSSQRQPGSDADLPPLTKRWPSFRARGRAGDPGVEWTRAARA
jgi:hypothetical protein